MEASFPKIGIALSGGAVRGAAHVGVLKALNEDGIRAQMISGTSIGSLVAALYAFGIPIEDIFNDISQLSWKKILSFKISKMGLFTNRDLLKIVEKWIGNAHIENARIPLAIVATNLINGRKVVFRQGSVAEAVVASTCLPGFFTPVEYKGQLLVDGFLVENVPVSPLQEMGAEFIIAVNLGAERNDRPDGLMEVMTRSFEIALDQNTRHSLRNADVVIEPCMCSFARTHVEEIPDIFQEGYRAAREQCPLIKRQLQRKRQLEQQ